MDLKFYGAAIFSALMLAGCQQPGSTVPALAQANNANASMNASDVDAVTQRFVIRSDTQYPRTDESIDDKAASARLIEAQDAAINDYRTANGLVFDTPIFLNGDLTEYGHGDQRDYMKKRLRAMPMTFYGLGNHDYENNVTDNDSGCLNNGCSSEMVLDLIKNMPPGLPFDEWEEPGGPLRHTWHGSMSYSVTLKDFTFIQLNNHYNYKKQWPYFNNLQHKFFDITPSLDWLEVQLRAAREQGKHVVINMHRSPTDAWMGSEADRERFKTMVNDYEVVAIFHGHTHAIGEQPSLGNVPVFQSGAAFKKTFLVAEYAGASGNLKIRQATNNVPGTTLADIPVLRTAAVPAPEVIAVSPGTLQFRPREPGYKGRRFSFFEISLNGGAYQRIEGDSVTFNGLSAGTSYNYTLRATDVLGQRSPTPYSGVARTLPNVKAPRNLCLKAYLGLTAHWEPAEPDYWPAPFFFHVALLDAYEHVVETIKGAQDYSTLYQADITRALEGKSEAQIKQLDLGVEYVTGLGTGRSPWTKLPLKWIYGTADEIARVYCPD